MINVQEFEREIRAIQDDLDALKKQLKALRPEAYQFEESQEAENFYDDINLYLNGVDDIAEDMNTELEELHGACEAWLYGDYFVEDLAA